MESVGTTKSMLFKKGQNCNYKHYEESDAIKFIGLEVLRLISYIPSGIQIDNSHPTCVQDFFGIGFVPPSIRCQEIGTQGC